MNLATPEMEGGKPGTRTAVGGEGMVPGALLQPAFG